MTLIFAEQLQRADCRKPARQCLLSNGLSGRPPLGWSYQVNWRQGSTEARSLLQLSVIYCCTLLLTSGIITKEKHKLEEHRKRLQVTASEETEHHQKINQKVRVDSDPHLRPSVPCHSTSSIYKLYTGSGFPPRAPFAVPSRGFHRAGSARPAIDTLLSYSHRLPHCPVAGPDQRRQRPH